MLIIKNIYFLWNDKSVINFILYIKNEVQSQVEKILNNSCPRSLIHSWSLGRSSLTGSAIEMKAISLVRLIIILSRLTVRF